MWTAPGPIRNQALHETRADGHRDGERNDAGKSAQGFFIDE